MQNLDLKFVYGALSPKEKEGVIKMWTKARVVSAEEAERRVEEVSIIMFFGDEIVGVSTVYQSDLSEKDDTYFFSRIFIQEQYRGSDTYTNVFITNFHELKKRYAQQIHGLVIELENKKFAHLGANTDYMSKRGFTYHGKNARGLQLWYVKFNEPKGFFAR